MSAVLVTGASGLIGNAVRERLVAAGRKVLPIDIVAKPGHAPVTIADLGDVHRLHALASQHDVDAVVHCGAVSGPMVSIDNPHAIVQANVVGTANVLELARVRRFRRAVFCSSTSAYGPTQAPASEAGVPEDVPLFPSSVYGATKVACEQLLAAYRKQHRLDAVSIRLCWVYGPGRTTDCVIRTMIEDAQAGRATDFAWGADFPRQFIHVDDATTALVTALDAPAIPREVYAATGGSWLTIGEIVETMKRVMPESRVTIADGPDPLDDWQHRFDTSAIRRDLGFAPAVSLEAGVSSYAAWLRR